MMSLVGEDDRLVEMKGSAAVVETVIVCSGRENQTVNCKVMMSNCFGRR